MFNLELIATKRKQSPSINYDIIYEWEDVIAEQIGIELYYENKWAYNKIIRCFPMLPSILMTNRNILVFDIYPTLIGRCGNKQNVIPVIVDFYIKDKKHLSMFYESYKKNKVVLISSKEVYDYLIQQECPLNIKHWPLSISDKYQLKDSLKVEKCFDLILMGRPNLTLQNYAEVYSQSHPLFTYAYRIQKDGHWLCQTSKGEVIGSLDTRNDYMRTMMKARCGLYHTPGMDGGETRTNGFNQVTPRLFEYLVCGCHVISRYADNSDTEYFELDKITQRVNSYEEFEHAMDLVCRTNINVEKYNNYLNKQYTSTRMKQLREILETL